MIPGIAAFTRVGLNGQRFMKELDDRAVATWTLSEAAGGIQAFSWTPTGNRIQVRLHKNGVIEVSYNDLNAKDDVVGVFPWVTAGVEKSIATISGDETPGVAPKLDIKSIKLTEIDGLFLKATIETRGPVFADPSVAAQQSGDKQATGGAGDPGINGITYRIAINKPDALSDVGKGTVVWTIRGFSGGRGFGGGRGAPGGPRLIAAGDGVGPGGGVSRKTISVKGHIPAQLSGVTRAFVSADAGAGASPTSVADRIAPRAVSLAGLRSPETDLSTMRA